MDKSLFETLVDLTNEWRLEDETDVLRYFTDGLMDLDNGAWNDIWPVMDYNPPCLHCGAQLKYNEGLNLFQCPRCGSWIFANEYEYGELPDRDDVEAVRALFR